ncbi:MAG: capsule biosynthesis protein [Cereibacter sphaeroides]|uniref:Capsule biosynthesis protein n=1 Tax=Cereibacter sphaeroides TaxID=1063 RepID=A0A2W5SFD9_CERSP|nr:MAG: capsule biosynthesis protein [Cereibacter sphaeroides]
MVPPSVRAPAPPSRLRRRHAGLIASFVFVVLLPALVSAWYLWAWAADQYASYVGFSVRKQETGSAVEMLGGIAALTGSSTSDTDILYEYMSSPRLVAEIDAALDLRAIWSKADDPIFAYRPPGTIEDLLDHWDRKVRVSYDSGTRLIEIRVLAFDPDDATRIAKAILERSSRMINDLSDIAREDTIRYARADLAETRARVTEARAAMTAFRNRTQIVDPAADVQGQTGLLAKLQEQLADALIAVDMLAPTTQVQDHRLEQAQARVKVIETRITAERQKLGFGEGGDGGAAYAELMGEYEKLAADMAFAEESYRAARAGYDLAEAEARRQGRYLAAHMEPTRAESARFPQRFTLLGTITLFLLLGWATLALVYYSLRDRR